MEVRPKGGLPCEDQLGGRAVEDKEMRSQQSPINDRGHAAVSCKLAE